VNTGANDTLHYIIARDVPEPTRTELNKLLVNISLWYGFWHSFMGRVDRESSPLLSELAYAVQEFNHLLAQYGNFCIGPIFERFPDQLRPALTEQTRGKLKPFAKIRPVPDRVHDVRQTNCLKSRPQLHGLSTYQTYPTQL